MGVYFNMGNASSLNDIIDCRCSITKKTVIDNDVFTDISTKSVTSIWGTKNSEVVKLWERKSEALPKFLILGKTLKNSDGRRTMYVSDDLLTYSTLGTYLDGSITNPNTLNTDECVLEQGSYVGNLNGTFLANVSRRYGKINIGRLTKINGEWVWKIWDKITMFETTSLLGTYSTPDNNVIFINAKLKENNFSSLYFSYDGGDTWIRLKYNSGVNSVVYENEYFIFRNGNSLYELPYTTVNEWTEELFSSSVWTASPGSAYYINGTKYTLPGIAEDAILVAGLTWVIYSNNSPYEIYYSIDKGKSWHWDTSYITSGSSWAKNDIVSYAKDESGNIIASLYEYKSGTSIKSYYFYSGKNGSTWSCFPPIATQVSVSSRKNRVQYFKSIKAFICYIENSVNPYRIHFTDDSPAFSYGRIPETDVVIAENQIQE